jgi:hypothetical protein
VPLEDEGGENEGEGDEVVEEMVTRDEMKIWEGVGRRERGHIVYGGVGDVCGGGRGRTYDSRGR